MYDTIKRNWLEWETLIERFDIFSIFYYKSIGYNPYTTTATTTARTSNFGDEYDFQRIVYDFIAFTSRITHLLIVYLRQQPTGL